MDSFLLLLPRGLKFLKNSGSAVVERFVVIRKVILLLRCWICPVSFLPKRGWNQPVRGCLYNLFYDVFSVASQFSYFAGVMLQLGAASLQPGGSHTSSSVEPQRSQIIDVYVSVFKHPGSFTLNSWWILKKRNLSHDVTLK